ncbi:MAG: hypothetical protein E4H13_01715, partial [Calditrichales bacterium]
AKYQNLDREKRIYFFAFLISLLLHLVFLLVFTRDMLVIDLTPEKTDMPEEVTVVFPENKPKTIVENINETNEIPDAADFLSDYNSRARNEQRLAETANQPMSEGNIPFPNLSRQEVQRYFQKLTQPRKFSREALSKDISALYQASEAGEQSEFTENQSAADNNSPDNMFNQKEFSADQLGDLTLSTYAWEWAPYINAFKRKLYTVWYTPAAYHRLGLIFGQTVIRFTITRSGTLLEYEVLEHKGHESLEQSSVNAITAVFPFKPLPGNFPEETLTITARLIYPNLRRSN